MATKKTEKKKIVLVRTYSAGVHVGTLVTRKGQEVTLANTRRVWRWRGANSLHELSLHGASEQSCISEPIAENTLTEAIEVLPCTAKAAENLSRSRWNL